MDGDSKEEEWGDEPLLLVAWPEAESPWLLCSKSEELRLGEGLWEKKTSLLFLLEWPVVVVVVVVIIGGFNSAAMAASADE